MDDVGPLNNRHCGRIGQGFGQLKFHQTSVMQPIKIVVNDPFVATEVFFVERKSWASDFVRAAKAFGNTADQSCFATTQVADQLDAFTALQVLAQCPTDRLGGLGACG